MNSKLMGILIAAALSNFNDNPGFRNRLKAKEQNSKVVKTPEKELRPFTVKGELIMAYSKRDAKKRYNYENIRRNK